MSFLPGPHRTLPLLKSLPGMVISRPPLALPEVVCWAFQSDMMYPLKPSSSFNSLFMIPPFSQAYVPLILLYLFQVSPSKRLVFAKYSRAHHTGYSSLYRISKRPQIEFMHDPVGHVTAHRLSVPLLLIADIVFSASLDTSFLHTLDRVFHRDTNEVRVSAETLPVTSTSWDFAHRA